MTKENLLKLRELFDVIKSNSWNPANVENLAVDGLVICNAEFDAITEAEAASSENAKPEVTTGEVK